MVKVLNNPSGRRFYLFGKRVHHGSSGIVLTIVGMTKHYHWLTLLGTLLIVHDYKDITIPIRNGKFPLTDKCNH